MRVATLAVLAASLSNAALAADFGSGVLRGTHYGAQAVTPIAHWDGAYFGGFAGVTSGDFDLQNATRGRFQSTAIDRAFVDVTDAVLSGDLTTKDARERAFGAFAGLNYQFDEVVLGFEADYTRAEHTATQFTPTINFGGGVRGTGTLDANLEDFGTLRARAGYTIGRFMPFVTAGLALGRADVSRRILIEDAAGSRTYADSKESYSIGFAAGLGVDALVTQNLFLRAEWQYVRFTDFGGVEANLNTLRAAAAVKF